MEEKNTILSSSTLIPIGAIGVIASIIWFMSSLNTKVITNDESIKNQEVQIQQLPRREEFNTLSADVREIKSDVKALIQKK